MAATKDASNMYHGLGAAARCVYLAIILLLVVYVSYSSIHDTTPDNAPYGGARDCFGCNNGWNWHVILMTLAYAVMMTESVLAFKAPLVNNRGWHKWVHLATQTAVGICVLAGLTAIIKAKLATFRYACVHSFRMRYLLLFSTCTTCTQCSCLSHC